MASQQLKRNRPTQLGVSPTNSQKLIYIANKLGLNGIKDMQGATVNIFDTVALVTATGRQKLTFFENTQGKSANFCNFAQGFLNAGETLIMETLRFTLLELSAASLTADTTYVTNMWPLAAVPDSGVVGNRSALKLGVGSINIANSTVSKNFQLIEVDPNFNRRCTGISPANGITATDAGVVTITPLDAIYGPSTIHLEAPPVLPPNQRLTISVEFPPVGTCTGNLAIMCTVGDFGSIFAAKTTL